MKKLICTVGLPRSGKTTWAKEQLSPIVNPDSIRLALHGQRYQPEAEHFVWAIAKVMVRSLFLAGHDFVIVDATNTTEKRRKDWVSDEWETVFHHIKTSKEVCIERAQSANDAEIIPVIERMSENFEEVVK